MKTADAMRELLKENGMFISTEVKSDSVIDATAQNVDIGVLQLVRKHATRVKQFGDGYLVTALVEEAMMNVIHKAPKTTLNARAIRFHKDIPDELFGRDLARARAKRRALYMQAAVLQELTFLFAQLTAVTGMAVIELSDRIREVETLESALLYVSHHRPHYPREKNVVTVELAEVSPEAAQASADSDKGE